MSGYTVGSTSTQVEGGPVADSVLRHDLVAGTSDIRSFGPDSEASEFVFVPDGPDAPEDAGTLMGYVYDRATDRSDLVLLDAATLDTVASVGLPARVPHGFHGSWMPVS